MSDLNPLLPLWNAILDVYAEFVKVCKENGLRHYVGEGNAIGALRHGGFIPWDDDFDVLMPRPDYERFREISANALPPHLKFLDWRNAPEMRYMFGKIQDTREDVVHAAEKGVGRILADGIYIDILVIDAMPDGPVSRHIYKVRRWVLYAIRRRWATSLRQWRWRGKLIWLVGWMFSRIHGVKSLDDAYRAMEHFMESVPFGSTGITWREGALAKTTNMEIPARVWDGIHEVPYGAILVPLPAGYDEYLRMQYGDYMTPPSTRKRVSTHARTEYSPWWLGPTREMVN